MHEVTRSIFQFLPSIKGKLRVARVFYKRRINNQLENFFKVRKNIFFFVPNLTENIYFELYVNGYYERETINFFIKEIPQNGVFIDVGANIGSITVFIAKLRPDVKIFAFEPEPTVYAYLVKNIEINDLKNVVVYNYAVHKLNNIELPFYSRADKSGKGSFSNVFTDNAVMVRTINLDNFFIQTNIIPSAIKVDVEGYEKLVFESMEFFLKKSNNCFIFFEFVDWAEKFANECMSGDAQKKIKEYGFHIMELQGDKLSKRNFIQYEGSCKNLVATKNMNFSNTK